MTELGIVIIVVAALALVVLEFIPKTETIAQPQQPPPPPPLRLSGCTFAVAFVQPDGSISGLEAEVINQLLKEGADCFPVPGSEIRQKIRNAEACTFSDGQLLIGGIVRTGRFMNTIVDFRCFAADGRICGAGCLEGDPVDSMMNQELYELSAELVRRIRIERVNEMFTVRVGSSRPVTLTRTAISTIKKH